MKIGFIGIVEKEMQQDFWGTLSLAQAMGYEGIELGPGMLEKLDLSPAEIGAGLRDMGLPAIGYHTTKYGFADAGPKLMADARNLGCSFLIMAWGPVESREQLLEDAALYNRIGQQCRSAGLQLTYHNHDHEFQEFDGQYAFDILMQHTDPDMLQAHIDVAWVTFGGADPVALIRRYAGRCPVLHMKDFSRLEPGCETAAGDRQAACFTEVGTGIVDTAGVVDAARRAGVAWLTVEQDRMGNLTPMESLRTSYTHLRALVDKHIPTRKGA
jgi:sugar phosphate isomerase/epimerase